jgi:activating signal cointegrator 1
MRTLSLHQPWAWFVVAGFKNWETRSWRADCFGPLLIHASKKVCPVGRAAYDRVIAKFGREYFGPALPSFEGFARGSIIGKVQFDCVGNYRPKVGELEIMLGDFSEGRWFFRMNRPQAFENPIPARGFQRFWNYDGKL